MRAGYAVFDLDGTLVDSAAICTAILNEMLHDRGSHRRLSCEQTRGHLSVGGSSMISALFGEECGDPTLEIKDFRARYADRPTDRESLYAGVAQGLSELHEAGVTLAICSNKPQNLCEKVLDDLHLTRYFSAIVGSSHGVPKKPDTTMFYRSVDAIGGQLDRCCFVGDSELDHETAQTAGVPFIFVEHGYAESNRLAGSIHCDDFLSVPQTVLEILNPDYRYASRVA